MRILALETDGARGLGGLSLARMVVCYGRAFGGLTLKARALSQRPAWVETDSECRTACTTRCANQTSAFKSIGAHYEQKRNFFRRHRNLFDNVGICIRRGHGRPK